jgi:triacylglycerol lipase
MRLSPPSLAGGPPLWRESRVGLELAGLLRDPVFRGEGVADGRGQPVMLIPGFLAGDRSLGVMAGWLKRNGYRPVRAGMRIKVGCSGEGADRLEERLEQAVQKQGQRAVIVGQSRGGHFAKVLARRRPDLVSGIVALGSPQLDPLAISPVVWGGVVAVGALGTLGARGMFKRGCLEGDCCSQFWVDCSEKLPRGTGYVSVYSKSDGVVDWRSCLDPGADHVEISSSHCGMAVSAGAYWEIADTLKTFRRREAARERRRSTAQAPAKLRRAA